MKDILIIGGGVVGCAVARELSRYDAKVLVLEGGNDVSVGASKANSGIVHSGIDAKPGSKKAYFNIIGAGMMEQLCLDLDVPFRRNGSMVLCFDQSDSEGLKRLQERGIVNGVKHSQIISGDQARRMEPNISEQCTSALYVPSGGIVSPYELTVAYAENATENGVEFLFGKFVTSVRKSGENFLVTCQDDTTYEARVVVNCAGVFADKINNELCKQQYKITPRKGEYCVFDIKIKNFVSATVFQLPTKMGKGVLVTPTTHGNIMIGPTSNDIDDKCDVDTTIEGMDAIWEKAQKSVPNLSKKLIIRQFAGLRAHEQGDDFVVGESDVKGFFNALGIESPGLTAAPAIAVQLAQEIATSMGLGEKDCFQSTRKAIVAFSGLTAQQRAEVAKDNKLYGKIVCRCELVTEAEIVDSLRRKVPARDVDGVKRRTRAGMGRCQSGFCLSRVMEIIARERGIDVSEVTLSGSATVAKGWQK